MLHGSAAVNDIHLENDTCEPVHVIKLGGSLLDMPDLPARLTVVMNSCVCGRALLVVGGAEAADIVRKFDAMFGLEESTSHWLAVRAMQLNAHLIQHVLKLGPLVAERNECEKAWQSSPLAIVDPFAWLEREERRGITVPHRWAFTSESIAAHLAVQLKATRLTLLKSTLPTLLARDGLENVDALQDATEQGIVDGDFAATSNGLATIDIINLRHASLVAGCVHEEARCLLRGSY
jgi:aspartokinase-like uncharacterized kinase